MNKMKGTYFFTMISIMLVLLQPYGQAHGQESSACDPVYFEALSSKAWAEAQRRVTMNQSIITQNDSVLALTCLDQHYNVLADSAENMFSESQRWGGVGVSTRDMDIALTRLSGGALSAYQTANFSPNALGGRGEPIRQMDGRITGGAYNCEEMNNVWPQAQCRNFEQTPEEGFMTFDELQNNDPRPGCSPDSRYETELTNAYQSVDTDDVRTYRDVSGGESCIPDNYDLYETIARNDQRSGVQEYRQGHCRQNFCIYVPTSMDSGRCVPNASANNR